jgi:hypothetical protein
MSEVEQLAQEQFNTFKNRLCEILSEIEEEYKSVFIQGYAKGETDEKFRTKQVVTRHIAELEKENAKLKTDYEVLSCSVGDFGELQNKLEEEQRKNNGLSDNLTKAKDLLKRCYENYIYLEPLRSEIEQFLNSEVEK